MKKFFLFFFLLSSLCAFCQTSVYHPFPDSNAVWKVTVGCMGPHPYPYCSYWQYYIAGDTTINSTLYKKISLQRIDVFCTQFTYNYGGYFIRQDTSAKKVFQYNGSFENLLFDFSLNVGDTFPNGHQVISIDSVLLYDNTYRKTFNIYNPYAVWNSNYTLIEGIGTSCGLFETTDPEYGNWLCSFTKDSTLLLGVNNCVTASDTCQNVGINEIAFQDDIFEVYPNPSSGNNIIVKTSLNEEITLRITDAEGKELYNKKFFKTAEIPAAQFSAGTYFYSACTAKHIRNGMFVVE